MKQLSAFLCAVCFSALVPAALADQPRIVPIDVAGATGTIALGINPQGDIVGGYVDSAGLEHGFVLRNGEVETYDFPGALWTEGLGINPRGDIVGQYGRSNGTVGGFLLAKRSGELTEIEIPPRGAGPVNSMPFKIAPDGTVTGCYHESLPGTGLIASMVGFMIGPSGEITVDPQAGSMYTGVGPDGTVTGHFYVNLAPNRLTSFVIKGQEVTYLDYPGARITRAYDINASGEVVGFYRDLLGKFHGFLYAGGEFTSIDVDLPGVLQTRAYGISAGGEIVGYYQDAAGVHGFLLTRRRNHD